MLICHFECCSLSERSLSCSWSRLWRRTSSPRRTSCPGSWPRCCPSCAGRRSRGGGRHCSPTPSHFKSFTTFQQPPTPTRETRTLAYVSKLFTPLLMLFTDFCPKPPPRTHARENWQDTSRAQRGGKASAHTDSVLGSVAWPSTHRTLGVCVWNDCVWGFSDFTATFPAKDDVVCNFFVLGFLFYYCENSKGASLAAANGARRYWEFSSLAGTEIEMLRVLCPPNPPYSSFVSSSRASYSTFLVRATPMSKARFPFSKILQRKLDDQWRI